VSFFNLFGSQAEGDARMATGVHYHTLPPKLEALRARTWRELAAARALRFTIASVLILGVGYALFAGKFVGNWNDIMAIFVWAFTANISVDAVMESVRPVKL
jgi:predicted anti-sigma-YlaC factor YlaD